MCVEGVRGRERWQTKENASTLMWKWRIKLKQNMTNFMHKKLLHENLIPSYSLVIIRGMCAMSNIKQNVWLSHYLNRGFMKLKKFFFSCFIFFYLRTHSMDVFYIMWNVNRDLTLFIGIREDEREFMKNEWGEKKKFFLHSACANNVKIKWNVLSNNFFLLLKGFMVELSLQRVIKFLWSSRINNLSEIFFY